jgi:hypothetical protein
MAKNNAEFAEAVLDCEDESVTRIRLRGPLEVGSWPETLQARVVTPEAEPKVHGYDAESDLALYYSWIDLSFLALTGELPSASVSAALNVVAIFLSPVSTAHASTHATVLSRLCGATTSETVGVAAIAMGERSRRILEEHEAWIQWCANRTGPFPEQFRGRCEADVKSVDRLRRALESTGIEVPGLELSPTRTAALILVLYFCGIRRRQQLEAVFSLFALPCAVAEAFGEKVGNFGNYPINLPTFELEE